MDTTLRALLGPNATAKAVLDSAFEVHSALGAGMLESTVCACLLYELTTRGLHVQHQVRLPIVYKGIELPAAYRVDFVVEQCLIVEVKCVEKLLPVHLAQLMSYLKLSQLRLGLLLNFNVPHMKSGIKRVINGPQSEL
jgi:GxxExxY protein